jgi:hypothetical protein
VPDVSVPNGTYRASEWVRSGGGQKNLPNANAGNWAAFDDFQLVK